jgi:hypothetical protein
MSVALLPDALWDLVEPLLPIPPRRPKGGRPRVFRDRHFRNPSSQSGERVIRASAARRIAHKHATLDQLLNIPQRRIV